MAKRRKPKYYAYQLGGSPNNFNWSIPEDESPSVVNQTATGATDVYGNKYFTPDNSGTPTTNNPNTVPIRRPNILDSLVNQGQKDINPAIQALNTGMQTVTGIANLVNDVKGRKYEKDQYLRSITPDYYENMEGYGLNSNPVFTQYGGATKYQVGGRPTTADSLALYNNTDQILKYYRGKKYTEAGPTRTMRNDVFQELDKSNKTFIDSNKSKAQTPAGFDKPVEYRKNIDSNRFLQRESANSIIDTNAPMALYDRRVKPTMDYDFMNLTSKDNMVGDAITVPGYDPIAVKPWNMLTPDERSQRIAIYGKPKSNSGNPQPTPPPPPTERYLPSSTVKDSEGRINKKAPVKGWTNRPKFRGEQLRKDDIMPMLTFDDPTFNIPEPGYTPRDFNFRSKYSASFPEAGQQRTSYFPDREAWSGFVNNNSSYLIDTQETPERGSATLKNRPMQTGGQIAANDPSGLGLPDPTDAYYSANATLAYYKEKLNNQLKAKNPQGFQDYFKGLVDIRRTGNTAGANQYVQDTQYNDFLTPDEVKGTLGDSDYDNYLKSLQSVNTYNVQQGRQPLWGNEEGQNDVTKLNYGRRFASLQVTPSYSNTTKNKTTNTTYNRNYQYNPQTRQVDILESGDLSARPSNFQPVTKNRMQAGGVSKTYGLQEGGKGLANVEAERGEVVQNLDGSMDQVAADANTHEQGGVFLPDVHRVLENTSNIRKDKTSKLLKLSPAIIKEVTGADVKGSTSHAEALVKANDFYEGKRNKITKKIELAAKDRNDLDKYGELSTKLNVQQFAAIPSQEQIFENLFNHQETVKAQYGINNSGKAKAQLGGYSGSKTGMKTPAGNPDKFSGNFDDYLKGLSDKGFKYEGIGSNSELQKALYDYKLKHGEFDDLRNMWKEGMHQTGMTQAKKLGFVDDKGNFKPGVLDSEDNLKKLADLYPDNMLGPRILRVDKGKKPPRIWSDDDIPTDEVPIPTQNLDTSITPTNIIQQPRSKFNEPLRWYDVASPVNAYIAALEREPGKYNPAEFNQLRYKLQDPTAALQQNQADFNAGVQGIQDMSANNPGAGMANISNLSGQKYAANNQILGQYENQNAQIKNNEITYNTQVRDKNSLADQQAREVFENKVLTSKAIQQEQKLTAMDSLYKTIAENRALNRNGNLIMKFSRAFDQYGEYNGYQPIFGVNPALGIPQIPTTVGTGSTGAAGGVQQLAPGKSYYNRKTGKTLYFDGNKLVERK